ncbi:hypothetical protein ACP275_11G095300 [Erythranthe tilingii]
MTSLPWHTELYQLAEERYDSVYEVLIELVAEVESWNIACLCRKWQISGFPCAHCCLCVVQSEHKRILLCGRLLSFLFVQTKLCLNIFFFY